MKKLPLTIGVTSTLLVAAQLAACSTAEAPTIMAAAPEAVVGASNIQATMTLRLAGQTGQRRIMDAGDPWTAADLQRVRVALFRNTGSAWVQVGADQDFDTPANDFAEGLTLRFGNLAASSSYRVAAVAFSDAGTTRVDKWSAKTLQEIADDGVGNHVNFSTGSAATVTVTANLSLVLADKTFSGTVNGTTINVTSGSVSNPLDSAATITSSVTTLGTYTLNAPTTQVWVDSGIAVDEDQEIKVTIGAGDTYHDGAFNTNFTGLGSTGPGNANRWITTGTDIGDYGAVVGNVNPTSPVSPADDAQNFGVGIDSGWVTADVDGTLWLAINGLASGSTTGDLVVTVKGR